MKVFTRKLWYFGVALCLFTHGLDARKLPQISQLREPANELDVPANFGKTHFIVGYKADQAVDEVKETAIIASSDTPFNLVCDGRIKQVFFAPDDSVQDVLIHLINSEKLSIKLTAYSLTDNKVAKALMEAQERGVNVEMVVDPSCLQDKFGKVPMLQEHGFPVYIYNPNHHKNAKSFLTSLMHNKFIIFGRNMFDKSLVWTGSFNITRSAHQHNQENVLVLDDATIVKKYEAQFQILKSRSHQPKNNTATKLAARDRKRTKSKADENACA